MKCNTDWRTVEEKQGGQFVKPPAGGYIVRIINAVDTDNDFDPANPYLKIYYDIETDADGGKEFANFYTKRYEESGYAYPWFRRNYAGKSAGFFKHFLNTVERSNTGRFKTAMFNNDERKLKGMYIGIVLGYKEFKSKDENGNEVIREQAVVTEVLDMAAIPLKEYKIPELKKLSDSSSAAAPAKPSGNDFGSAFGNEQLPW